MQMISLNDAVVHPSSFCGSVKAPPLSKYAKLRNLRNGEGTIIALSGINSQSQRVGIFVGL